MPWWGAVAQLGERLVRNEEVSGSIPLSSTNNVFFRRKILLHHNGLRNAALGTLLALWLNPCGNLACGLSEHRIFVMCLSPLLGVSGGDDGARTRDLCRDRAAL